MKNIKSIKVSSRRSSPVGKEFFTFEMTIEADVSNMTEEEREEQVKEMWNYTGEEVDNQFINI